MTIEEGLVTYLRSVSAITAVVGQRIYPRLVPQGNQSGSNLPAITYQMVSGNPLQSLSGSSGFTTERIQLNCWALDDSTARSLRELLRLNLDGYAGLMGTVTAYAVLVESKGALPFRASEETDARRQYGHFIEIAIQCEEAKPAYAP